ncbi:response regulator transcription factor [Longispora sp. NPDC051575]|uniref:response regulator transcription factor n=1 Tax=Longispora sp. NPDC051575 TaxID=3154943 RepID=UPI0034203730
MARVLIVEDAPQIRLALAKALTAAGHTVRSFGGGTEALPQVVSWPADLVVLDLGLPDIDGEAVLGMIRGVSRVPVVVATARDTDVEVVRLLRAGADDYLIKPFSAEQLGARIEAVLRRSGATTEDVLVVGGLRVSRATRQATLDGVPLKLTRMEFDLLAYLAERQGRVISRQELLNDVWRQPFAGGGETVDVHVSWLRRKLGETASQPRYLHTVRGVGFRIAAP